MRIKANIAININSGAGLILWALGFFGLLWMAQHHPSIQALYPVAVAGWTGGFIAILFKRYSDNKLDLEAARSGVGESLGKIKVAASST